MDTDTITNALASNSLPNFTTNPNCKGLAIITGGSSGIGYSLALRASSLHLTVVILDLNPTTFPTVIADCKNAGATDCVAYQCDVSSFTSVQTVANTVLATYSDLPVTLICANAGYGGPPLLSGTASDIQNQHDVLINGIVWTVKAFQERFLKQKEPCVLVGTSSLAGLFPAGGSYGVGKHGAVAVMEALYGELNSMNLDHTVTCHVLCPGIVSTGITQNSAELNGGVAGHEGVRQTTEEAKQSLRGLAPTELMRRAYMLAFRLVLEESGMPSSYAADTVMKGIETGTFYLIMDHPDERYSTNSDMSIALRHRRLEIGAPPPSRADFLNSNNGGLVESVMNRAQQLMVEATRESVEERTKIKANM